METAEQLKDRCRGALVGGAVGDALGYPVEFVYSFNEIRTKYGENGIEDYDLSYPWLDDQFHNALFSDDTQMTLYTIEGILETTKEKGPVLPAICNAYLVWWGHQMGKKVKTRYNSTLSEIDELNQRRAPGNTCMSALYSIYSGKEPVNASKGCGGVMRVAPIGLYGTILGLQLVQTAKLAGEVAELTHLHPLSTYSSAALAVIVQLCIETVDIDSDKFKHIVDKAIKVIKETYGPDAPSMDEFEDILRRAVAHENDPRHDWEIIENSIGEGWVAEETLAIAAFSVLRHIDDFNGCLICAVNHGGDSDSTGAVAGNIIGAITGYKNFPEKFTRNLQLRELILSMSDALCETKNLCNSTKSR